jgi:hypothetical protein
MAIRARPAPEDAGELTTIVGWCMGVEQLETMT